MDKVECPYCGEENEVCHDDGENYAEYEVTDTECRYCDKIFQISTSISFYHEANKADCLNGLCDHNYEQIIGHPREIFVGCMRCGICGKEKTDHKLNERSRKDYIDKLSSEK